MITRASGFRARHSAIAPFRAAAAVFPHDDPQPPGLRSETARAIQALRHQFVRASRFPHSRTARAIACDLVGYPLPYPARPVLGE